MSLKRVFLRSRTIATACVSLVLFIAGCGTKEEPAKPTPTGQVDATREDLVAKQRQRELDLKKKLESVKMPPEFPREWFYDGDGTIDLKVQWQADDSRLHLAVVPGKSSPKSATPASSQKTVVGFYVADTPRGPFTYVDRVLGAETTLESPFTFNDVKDHWYKAVVFDPDSALPVVEAQTTPVQPAVTDYRQAKAPAVAAPVPKAPAPKTPAKPGPASAKEIKPETPVVETPVVVVLPLVNGLEKERMDRLYFGRGLSEILREFLAQTPKVTTLDPGYVDAVAARTHITGKTATTVMAGFGSALRADIVLTGTFESTPDGLKLDLSFLRVSTSAVMKSRVVTAQGADTAELGKALAAELGRGLGVTFSDAETTKLSAAWKALDERRGFIEKALALHDVGRHEEALTAFESMKPELVMDAQVLTAMSETYADRGKMLDAARLATLAGQQPLFRSTPEYFDRIGRMLRSSRDLKASLEVLADAQRIDPEAAWTTAMGVLDRAFSSLSRANETVQEKSWPMRRPKWDILVPGVALNPVLGDDSLAVFGSEDREILQSFGPGVDPSRRTSLKSTYASPDPFQTCVYSLATGELTWRKSKLLSAAATPVISEGVLYGVGNSGPVAVSLKTGDVIWEDKKGPLSLPAMINTADEPGREGWKTFEIARVGRCLVVWLPRDVDVHVYEAATGKYLGAAFHNRTWGRGGQFFLRRPDGLYFLTRGGAGIVKLTDQLLANPAELTTQMRLLADPAASLEGDLLIETTRTVATSDTSRFDHLVVGTDVKRGDFAWIYPLLSKDPPVIADGKLFIYKQDISGQQSTRVQRIDVTNEQTDLIDLGGLEISLYEPTMSLLDGKAVLIGSQAAISADGKLLWVNRALPVTHDARMVGGLLLVPPFLVDPATGHIVAEIDAPPGLHWNTTTMADDGKTLILSRVDTVKRGNETAIETHLWGYDLGAAGDKAAEAAPAAKAAAAPRLTVEAAKQYFFDSRIAAPPDDRMTDLFEHLARRTYEDTADPAKAMELLADTAKTHPRNGRHAVRLLALMKPYVSMSGNYDVVLAVAADLRTAYAKRADIMTSLAAEDKSLQTEKADTARAREYFETVKQTAHDPLEDWASEWPANGLAVAGASAAPPFNVGWTAKGLRTSAEDRLLPLDAAVLVWQAQPRILTAFKTDDNTKLWDMPNVWNVVYYRGIVYVLTSVEGAAEKNELRAVTPTTGLVLWRKQTEIPAKALKDTPLAAGLDRIFVGLPDDIAAYDWATGADVYRQPVGGRTRLDVHGSVLMTSNRAGNVVALDAKSGNRLWAKDLGTYSLFNGMLYSVQVAREAKRLDLSIVVYQAATGREFWRRHYDLPPSKRAPEVMPPGVTMENLFVVCDLNLVQIKREDGETVATQTLSGNVSRPFAASTKLVYLLSSDRWLKGYDTETGLASVWQLPTSGIGTIAAARGTLYVLDSNELKAFRGTPENWSVEYLKALATPAVAPPAAEGEGAQEVVVTASRYISIGSMRGRKELPVKLDDKRLGEVALLELLNFGHMSDWKGLAEETTQQLPPGQRKFRTLTEPEVRALFSEMIQRREPGSAEYLKDALRGGNRQLCSIVLDALATGDRGAYGPMLVHTFKETMDLKDFQTAANCAQTIGKWNYAPGVSTLASALLDVRAPENVRVAAAKALAEFDNPEALGALLKASQDEAHNSAASLCTELLVHMGADGVKAIAGLLATPSGAEAVRLNAAAALGPIRSTESTAALLTALRAASGGYPIKIRAAAAIALAPAAKDSDDAFDALVEVMKDGKADPLLRNACLNGLGFSGNPKAIPVLIAAMGDPAVDNRKFSGVGAQQLLLRLAPDARIGPYPDQWQAWWVKNKDRLGVKGP